MIVADSILSLSSVAGCRDKVEISIAVMALLNAVDIIIMNRTGMTYDTAGMAGLWYVAEAVAFALIWGRPEITMQGFVRMVPPAVGWWIAYVVLFRVQVALNYLFYGTIHPAGPAG